MSKKIKRKYNSKFKKIDIVTNKTKASSKQYAKLGIVALFFLVIMVGGSYAYLTTSVSSNKNSEVVAGTLRINFEDSNQISLDKAYPMSDTDGMNTSPYTFTIKNQGTLNTKYTINLEDNANNTLDVSNIRYSLKAGDEEWSSPAPLTNNVILISNKLLNSSDQITYQLKMWLKEDAGNEVQGLTYSAKVVVNAVQENLDAISTEYPLIKLNGDKIVSIAQNSEYTDLGVDKVVSTEALDKDDVVVSYEYFDGVNTTTVSSIDTSKLGVYYIYYSIADSKNNSSTASRVVNVYKQNTSVPTISLEGASTISLDYNEAYTEPGYAAADGDDGNLTSKVIVTGVVNSAISDVYTIKYIVVDSDGNAVSATRDVIVNNETAISGLVTNKVDNSIIDSVLNIEYTTTSSTAKYYVSETESKPADSQYIAMTGESGVFTANYTFKKNGTYYLYVKDGNNEVKTKTFQVTNIDETKPTCTFNAPEYIGLNNTTQIELTCTDPAGISNDLIESTMFKINNSNDVSITSVSTKETVTNGYTYVVTLTTTSTTPFTISLKENQIVDMAGNKNEELTTSEIKVSTISVDDSVMNLNLNGTSTGSIVVSGTNPGTITYESSDPSVATVGDNGTVTAVAIGTTTITVTESNGHTTATVTVNVKKSLTAMFNPNSSTLSVPTGCTEESGIVACSCLISDPAATSCDITTPEITAPTSTPTVIGFNTSASGTTMEAEDNSTLTLVDSSNNTNYYAITRKDERVLTATFNENGSTLSFTGDATCTLPAVYNGATQLTTCEVTAPTITAPTVTPNIVGFNNSANATTNNENYDLATGKLTISDDGNWYAITKSGPEKVLTVSFTRNTTETTGFGENTSLTASCTIPVSYNGVAQDTSCESPTKTPTFVAASGYSVGKGFYAGTTAPSTSSVPFIAENADFTITEASTDLANQLLHAGDTFTARARKYTASEIEYSNASTGLKDSDDTTNCIDTQCAIDALSRLFD